MSQVIQLKRATVDLVAGDKTYTLSLSMNALAELEAMLSQSTTEILAKLKAPSVVLCRAVLWAALRDHHRAISIAEAGELLGQVGLGLAMERVGEALMLAFPQNPPSVAQH